MPTRTSLEAAAIDFFSLSKAVAEDVNELVKAISVEVARQVAGRTPVDTGKARSNWQTSLSTPIGGTRTAFAAYPSRWHPPGRNPGGSMAETPNFAAAVRSAREGVSRRTGDEQDVYIVNNLPYIARLNQGYSKQAPAGYVRVGVAAGVPIAVRSFRFKAIEKWDRGG